jgi:hypothetical protein
VNSYLADYDKGYELTTDGEIVEVAEPGAEMLVNAELPREIGADIRHKVIEAVRHYRRRGATLTDRHAAVRSLADVFERLRPSLLQAIDKKDERDLFNIANNFAIRHDNDKQKTGYDRSLWIAWMFYFYLATLHYAARKLAVALKADDPGIPERDH